MSCSTARPNLTLANHLSLDHRWACRGALLLFRIYLACVAVLFGFTHVPASAGEWRTSVVQLEPVAPARDLPWLAPAKSPIVVALAGGERQPPMSVGAYRPESGPKPSGPRLTGNRHELSGVASYYWQEQMTATGERFDKRALTAAHKTLPFGTRVKVTRLDTGNNVVVRINDRGPYRAGRIIDLSERAAQVIGMTSRGTVPVKLEVLGR